MAQRMNKEDAETRRADGKPGEDESKCCRASEEISTFAINHGEKLGSRRQIGRNVGRCVHHTRRNAGRIEPYLVRGAEGRPLKGRIPTTYCRNSQRATYLRQGQTQLRNILTQPLQPESVAMQAPKIVPHPSPHLWKKRVAMCGNREQRGRSEQSQCGMWK